MTLLTCNLPGVGSSLAVPLGVETLGSSDGDEGSQEEQGWTEGAGHLRVEESVALVRGRVDSVVKEYVSSKIEGKETVAG